MLAATACCIILLLTIFTTSCEPSPTGFSLRLIPPTSAESPFYIGNLSESEKWNHYIMSKPRSHRGYDINTFAPINLTYSAAFYTVSISVGTPAFTTHLIVDTGSGLTWTQCEPCTNCWHQVGGMFDPKNSRSYRPISCQHQICRSSSHRFGCVNNVCTYKERYADGFSTNGIAADDRFGFLNGGRMVFGCAHENHNYAKENNTHIGGMLGLSADPESVISVLPPAYKRFSYCLTYKVLHTSSWLRFGNDVRPLGPGSASTPLIIPPKFSLYFVKLRDISIQNKAINYPNGTFDLQQNLTGGCVIDNGSDNTWIGDHAYGALMKGFQSYFAGQKIYKNPNVLCYHKTSSTPAYPSVTLHFEGGDLHLDPRWVISEFKGKLFCVNFRHSQNAQTIIGNYQQQNHRFIFDIDNHVLHFAPEDCALGH